MLYIWMGFKRAFKLDSQPPFSHVACSTFSPFIGLEVQPKFECDGTIISPHYIKHDKWFGGWTWKNKAKGKLTVYLRKKLVYIHPTRICEFGWLEVPAVRVGGQALYQYWKECG